MGKMQREKGAKFERYIVRKAKSFGLSAIRVAPLQTYVKNKACDAMVDRFFVEAKHHQKVSVASYDSHADKPNHILVYRHNGRRPKVVIDFEDFLSIISEGRQHGEGERSEVGAGGGEADLARKLADARSAQARTADLGDPPAGGADAA